MKINFCGDGALGDKIWFERGARNVGLYKGEGGLSDAFDAKSKLWGLVGADALRTPSISLTAQHFQK
jgi:hypothetical protein